MAADFVELLRRRWQKAYPNIDLARLSLEEMWDALAREGGPPDNGDPDTSDLLEWLKEQGPDDWHRCASTWNWDCDRAPIEWIIRQPSCDAGTAITLFARAEPGFYSQFESMAALEAGAGYMIDTIRFMIEICERWASGAYASYHFMPVAVAPVEADGLPWPIPATLANPEIKGQRLDLAGWSEGFPPESWIWQ